MNIDNLLTTYKHSDDINRVVESRDAIVARIAELEALILEVLDAKNASTRAMKAASPSWVKAARAALEKAAP